MSENKTTVDATPEQVWAVLADGWLYPLWVVGATRMRDVAPSWPEVGAALHHSVGAWPLVLDDETTVRECDPGRRLLLRAKGWPMGEAEVEISLEAVGGRTRVVVREDAVSGPGRLVPAPLRRPLIGFRNVETLRRLRLLVEGRAVDPGVGDA